MSQPLSIVMLSHMASPAAPTGAEHSLALLAGGLAGRGHRVLVVHPGPWALAGTLQGSGVETCAVPSRQCWLAYYAPRPLPVALFKWLRYTMPDPGRRRLRRLLGERRPDVVHVNCLPHVGGAVAASSAGLPVVWHLREILPPGTRRRWLARRVGRRARRVVAVSEAVGKWVREEGMGARLEVVPNGVAVECGPTDSAAARRELGLPADGCLFGLLGQLLPHKGAMEFIRAARLALNQPPVADNAPAPNGQGSRFLIAGDGPPPFIEQLREEVRTGEASDRFHLLPPQRGGERLIAACDVICITTTTPDPFPRTVLEAMAAGKPVAGFRSGGVPEMVVEGETGLLAEPGDVAALASCLTRLAENASLRDSLGSAASRRAREQFSLGRHIDRMERVLREVAES